MERTTHRLKGFSGRIDSDIVQGGDLHVPDLSNLQKAALFHEVPVDRQASLIAAGIPLISEVFADSLLSVRRIEVDPTRVIASDRSAHSVGFGQFLTGRTRKGKPAAALPVALKPFARPENAVTEAYGYRWLGGLGLETFEPVGVFPASRGGHSIGITKERKDLMSLDREEWVVGGRVDSERSAEIALRNERTVIDISSVLAFTHAHGGYLPDGQIKNWAVTPDGTIGPIDTEHFKYLSLGDPDAANLAWNDIEKLIRSLTLLTKDAEAKMFGVGMFHGLQLPQLRESINRLIILPYVQELDREFGDLTEEDITMVGHLTELESEILSRFHSDPTWPAHIAGISKQHHSYHAMAR